MRNGIEIMKRGPYSEVLNFRIFPLKLLFLLLLPLPSVFEPPVVKSLKLFIGSWPRPGFKPSFNTGFMLVGHLPSLRHFGKHHTIFVFAYRH